LVCERCSFKPSRASASPRFDKNGGFEIIVAKTIVDDSGTRNQNNTAIANGPTARVNNGRYAYGFGVCLGSDSTFRGARVTYTYNQAGD
jgi:hypothetical protein